MSTEDADRNFLRFSAIYHNTRRHIAEDLGFKEKQISVEKTRLLALRSAMVILFTNWLNVINLLNPTGHVMHQQFNIQQLYVLPHIVFMCFVIYLRTNSNLCQLEHKLIGFYNRDEKCLLRGTNWVFKYSGLRFVFKGLTVEAIDDATSKPGSKRTDVMHCPFRFND